MRDILQVMMIMTDKEKINNIIHYIIISEARYRNEVIIAQNSILKHYFSDPVQILNLYKAQCKLDVYMEISRSLERILFDDYRMG